MTKRLISFLIAVCLLIAIPLSARYKYNPFTRKLDYYEPVSGSDLGDLGDVTLTGLATGNVLYYNGTAWVNLATGANTNVLTLAGGVPTWAATGAPAAHAASHEVGGADLVDHDQLTNYAANQHRVWENSIAQNIHIDNIPVAGIDHGTLAGLADKDHMLNGIGNPTGNVLFTMTSRQIKYLYTVPATADGAFELEITGVFTGDVLHVHQHTGNPGAANLVVFEAEDADVVPLTVVGTGTYDILSGAIAVNAPGAAGEIGIDFTSINSTFSTIAQSDAEGIGNSSDLRIGLDETLRAAYILDRGDIGTDFGSTAYSHPTLVFVDAAADDYSYIAMENNSFYFINVTGTGFYFETAAFMDHIVDGAGGDLTLSSVIWWGTPGDGTAELVNSSGTQTWFRMDPWVNQTGTAAYNALIVDVTETSTGSGTNELLTLQVGSTDVFTIGNKGSLDLTMSDALSRAVIAQSDTTGTDGQALIYINDDRTGTYANEADEATIYIDAEGVYAIAILDGDMLVKDIYAGSVFMTAASGIRADNRNLMIGSGDNFRVQWGTNGGGDNLTIFSIITGATETAAMWYSIWDLLPGGTTEHDNYLSPTFVMTNNEGADANDYAGVVIGERAQADVKVAHYFDFYAMAGAADGSIDVADELAAIFRFGASGSAVPGSATTPGDVLFEGAIEVNGQAYFDADTTQIEDVFVTWADALDKMVIAQSAVAGTEDQALIYIDDDRIGDTANELSESTLVLESAGWYSLWVKDGSLQVDATSFFTLMATHSNHILLNSNANIMWGSGQDIITQYDINGASDDLWIFLTGNSQGANETTALWYGYMNPNGMATHDDYMSPTFIITNSEGADNLDYAGVVIGERAQADVAVAHYFDFWAMTGSVVVGGLDPTTTELAAIFRFGASGSAVPGSATTPGDVLFEGAIEVNGVSYFDGRVGTDFLPSSDGGFDLGDNTYAWQDIVQTATGAHYYGDTDTDTTWKIVRDGTKLSFLRRETGSYVEKGFFDTSFHATNIHLEVVGGISGALCWRPGTSPPAHDMGYRMWLDSSGVLWLLEQNANPETRVQNKIIRADENGKVSIEDLHITADNATVKLEDDSGNFAIIKAGNSQLTLAADPDDVVASTDIVFDMDGAEVARFQQGGQFQSLDSIIAKEGFATQLWDIAGANWETAVVNTEYYSPNQQGGIYGIVYRAYFTTSLPSFLTSGNNVSALIDYAIQFLSEGTNIRGVAHGNTSATGSSDKRCAIWLTGATGNNNLDIDKESTGDDYEPVRGWVDYTK